MLFLFGLCDSDWTCNYTSPVLRELDCLGLILGFAVPKSGSVLRRSAFGSPCSALMIPELSFESENGFNVRPFRLCFCWHSVVACRNFLKYGQLEIGGA